jgi:hypothetical protein
MGRDTEEWGGRRTRPNSCWTRAIAAWRSRPGSLARMILIRSHLRTCEFVTWRGQPAGADPQAMRGRDDKISCILKMRCSCANRRCMVAGPRKPEGGSRIVEGTAGVRVVGTPDRNTWRPS